MDNKEDKDKEIAPKEEDLLSTLPKFTPKQRQFIDNYVISMNATDACRKAGYDTPYYNRVGSQLLSKPHIRAEIERILRKSIEDDGEINPDFIRNGIKKTIQDCKNPKDRFIGYELLAKCVPGTMNALPENNTFNFTNVFAKIEALSRQEDNTHNINRLSNTPLDNVKDASPGEEDNKGVGKEGNVDEKH